MSHDLSCPLPKHITHEDARKVYADVRKEMRGVTDSALRREAARRMGTDYDTYLKAWKKPVAAKPLPITEPAITADGDVWMVGGDGVEVSLGRVFKVDVPNPSARGGATKVGWAAKVRRTNHGTYRNVIGSWPTRKEAMDALMQDSTFARRMKDAALKKPAASSAPAAESAAGVDRVGSNELVQRMLEAERQRVSLMSSRFNNRGNFNAATGWSSDSARAWTNYVEGGNKDMNLLKRDPKAFAAKEDADWVEFIAGQNALVEDILSKNTVGNDVTVARYMTGKFGNVSKGKYLADPGFLSTTTDFESFLAQPSAAFQSSVASGEETWTFIIKVPKGTNAIPGAEHQKEVVLGPGTKQKVLEVDRKNKIVYTEVV